MENVVVTPHVAWLTRQAIQRLVDTMVENILAYFMGEPKNVVNKVYYNPLSDESLRLRPTLGNQVSLDVCRALLSSLNRLGLEPYRAGKEWVEGMPHRFSRGHVEEAVLQLRELMRDARLGLVRPVLISDQACEIRLEESIRPPASLDGAPPADGDRPVCQFEAGVMAGVFEVVLGRPVQVEMCQCELRGHPDCHFTISPSAP
jgi:predicted hydrocarbon binding protein